MTAVVTPPERLARHQRAAAGWLAALPRTAGELLERWELTAERVVQPGGRAGLTLLVRAADGAPAALTIRPPGRPVAPEEAALRRWDGLGAVRVLRGDPAAGALLLERLRAGVSLRSLPDAKATLEAVSVVRRLWVDPGAGHPFGSVAERTGPAAETLRTGVAGPLTEAEPLVAEAVRAREELLAAPGEAVLLHGRFRQGSVLASDAERAPWLAVGPEPVVGERAFDLARLVRDRLPDLAASPGAPAVVRRRVAQLADAVEVDAGRLRGWALFRAVAAAADRLARGRRAEAEALLEFAAWL